VDGVRAEPAARILFRTFAGCQSMKPGSAQSIVPPTPEFATSPKVDGWQTLAEKPADRIIDFAA